MRVLVTGGNGFIGRWVVDQLTDFGHEPIVFDHHVPGRHSASWFGDVRDRTSINEACAHVDAVIHLAAVLGSAETVGNPYPAIETNIIGAVNVMEACLQYSLPMSMTSVGNAWLRADGAGTYTIAKECAADLFQMYRNYRGLRGNLVRPTNAYGPGQSVWRGLGGTSSVRKILPTFINQALQGKPIEIYGDGEQVSDMCWVGDVAETLICAMLHADGDELCPIAEVGPAEHLTVNQVAGLVQKEVERICGGSVAITHLPMRHGERSGHTIADPETLKVYGIEQLPFSEGLIRTAAYYYSENA